MISLQYGPLPVTHPIDSSLSLATHLKLLSALLCWHQIIQTNLSRHEPLLHHCSKVHVNSTWIHMHTYAISQWKIIFRYMLFLMYIETCIVLWQYQQVGVQALQLWDHTKKKGLVSKARATSWHYACYRNWRFTKPHPPLKNKPHWS